jgi:hypothetical protein
MVDENEEEGDAPEEVDPHVTIVVQIRAWINRRADLGCQ